MTENTTKIDPALATLNADIPALAISHGAHDPVHALIASAVERREAFLAAYEAIPDHSNENPQHRAAEALADQRVGQDSDAFAAFAACAPTTSAGVSAALKFFAARTGPDWDWDQEFLKTFLGNMAMALDRIEAGRCPVNLSRHRGRA